MTLICQKQIDICKSIQDNLDIIKKFYSEVDLDSVDQQRYAKQTLDLCGIDYSLEFWILRSLVMTETRTQRNMNSESEEIIDPGLKIVYSLTSDNPLVKNNVNVSGMDFLITKNYYSFVVCHSGFTLLGSTNPYCSDYVFHINYKKVRLPVPVLNERYDINLPVDISTWTEDDLVMLRMCV